MNWPEAGKVWMQFCWWNLVQDHQNTSKTNKISRKIEDLNAFFNFYSKKLLKIVKLKIHRKFYQLWLSPGSVVLHLDGSSLLWMLRRRGHWSHWHPSWCPRKRRCRQGWRRPSGNCCCLASAGDVCDVFLWMGVEMKGNENKLDCMRSSEGPPQQQQECIDCKADRFWIVVMGSKC